MTNLFNYFESFWFSFENNIVHDFLNSAERKHHDEVHGL